MSQNKSPLIGVFGWKTGENSFGASLPYLNLMANYGNVTVITPNEDIDPRIDLIVVPGGADVDPLRYGEKPSYYTSRVDPIKEYMETIILPQYVALGASVLGICRGCQSVSVLYGAKLIQHMYHEGNGEEEGRAKGVHAIDLMETTFKEEWELSSQKRSWDAMNKKNTVYKVNSMHHQCVSGRNFPEDLEVLARYRGGYPATIEAVRHKILNIYCVQWHPEEIGYDPLTDFIIEEKLLAKFKDQDE
jgi:putative glutamine amidotransferase